MSVSRCGRARTGQIGEKSQAESCAYIIIIILSPILRYSDILCKLIESVDETQQVACVDPSIWP